MVFSEQTALQLDREAWAEQDAKDRDDELDREQRWNAFVEEVKAVRLEALARDEDWWTVVLTVGNEMRWPSRFAHGFKGACVQFAETEGWDGVLSAIARAMREIEHDAAEVERRR